MAAQASQKVVQIDGTTLEGGGQILRLSLALSSLTGRPVDIVDIRGKRGYHGKDGGLKQAHLGGAAWLARASEAATEGLALRSRRLFFEPRTGTATEAKEVHKTVTNDGVTIGKAFQKWQPGTKKSDLDPIWTDIVENNRIVRRESSIALTTPGSVFGVLQAILPFILFHSQAKGSRVPLHVTVDGGTNVWHSMSSEWAQHVLFPILHEKLGIGPIEMQLHQRSWSTGPKKIGSITFIIPPLPQSSIPIAPFRFTDRGPLTKLDVHLFTPNSTWQSCLRDVIQSTLDRDFPDIQQEIVTDEYSGHPARLYLLLIAHSANGYRLGRDRLYSEKLLPDKMSKIVVGVARQVTDDLRSELDHGGCVDEYLQDQLVVFQTLAKGKSVVERGAPPSLHTQTARWVAKQVCGVDFDEDGGCEGIAYIPNE